MLQFSHDDLTQAINAATAANAKNPNRLKQVEQAAIWCCSQPGKSWKLNRPFIYFQSRTSGHMWRLSIGVVMDCSCRAQVTCWHIMVGHIVYSADRLRQQREQYAVAR